MKLMFFSFKALNISFLGAREKRKQPQENSSNQDENSVGADKQPRNACIKINSY